MAGLGARLRGVRHCRRRRSLKLDSFVAKSATKKTYDADGNPTASTGSVPNPFRYAGQYTDAETGLQYLRARFYDPSTAQFLSRDPIVALTRQAYT